VDPDPFVLGSETEGEKLNTPLWSLNLKARCASSGRDVRSTLDGRQLGATVYGTQETGDSDGKYGVRTCATVKKMAVMKKTQSKASSPCLNRSGESLAASTFNELMGSVPESSRERGGWPALPSPRFTI
jgi:hypothetical protein